MCEEAVEIDQESDRLWEIVLAHPEETGGTHPSYTAYHAHEDATLSHLHDLMQTVTQTPARTPEGLRAKAALARKAMPRDRVEDGDQCDRLALSLYADILGRAGA